jgi:amino acid adenylation domain-containing protein
MTLDLLLRRSAAREPARVAVIDRDRSITYRELDAAVDRLAARLHDQGIAPGDRVGIYLDKSLAAVIAIFAVLRVGAVYVPLDPASPVKRIASVIDDCRMRGLITVQKKLLALAPELSSDSLQTILVDQAAVPPSDDSGAVPLAAQGTHTGDADDLAYILYTSGSTGRPKGVMISQRAALAFIDWAAAFVELHAGDRVASHAPFHFDLSIFDLFAAIKVGAAVVLVPSELIIFPRSLADWIERQAITVWYSVPSALTRLVLQGGLERHGFAHLNRILFAGEVFPLAHLRDLQRAIPHARCFNFYGPTETNVCIACEVGHVSPDRTLPVPIGRACAGARLLILNEEGRPCAVGEIGELYVAGDTLMRGYWGMPAQTVEALAALPEHERYTGYAGVWYRTGDLVFQEQDETCHFCGRRDMQVKIRGYRIELGEIETVMARHPAVAEVAVASVAAGESLLTAFVVVRPGAVVDAAALLRFCAEYLPSYMVPGVIEFRSALPLTSTGKLDRARL